MLHITYSEDKIMKFNSPLTGKLIPITDVKDPVFAQKMMGDGFAIIPTSNEVYSPVEATIEVLYPTGHAIGLRTIDGIEILIHLGIDTVKSKSKSFSILKKVGDHVLPGELIIKMDLKKLLKEGYDMTTPIVFLSGQKLVDIQPLTVLANDELQVEFV